MCDSSKESLRRMREEIYPSRYQAWDKNIKLYSVEEVPKGGFDLILIGTPPDTHLPLAIEAVNELPKAVLTEKPLCEPSMTGLDDLVINAQSKKVKIFTGYNHAVGRSLNKIRDIIYENRFGKALTVDVEFREHWGGFSTRILGWKGHMTRIWVFGTEAAAPQASILTPSIFGKQLLTGYRQVKLKRCRLRLIMLMMGNPIMIKYAPLICGQRQA